MRTVAFSNQKGGSAKTTSAVNVAAALGELGKKVLLVDLDAQASASSWFGQREEGKGLLEVLTGSGRLADLVRETEVPGVSVVPASPWLVGADRALAGEPGAETLLRNKLRPLADRWDFVLLDTPPSLGLLAVSALVAAREVFVPVEPSPITLAGLVQLLETLDRVRDRLNPDLQLSGILLCRTDARTNLGREVEESLRARFGKTVFSATIPESVRFREAWSYQKPILSYAPSSPGAQAYRDAARELTRRTP